MAAPRLRTLQRKQRQRQARKLRRQPRAVQLQDKKRALDKLAQHLQLQPKN